MTVTQKKWLKRILLTLVLCCLAGLAYWYFKPKPEKPNYITATVKRGDIENNVMASGKIEAVNQVDVGAQVSGEVTHLYVKVGDEVQKGDIIAQIDPVTQRNNLTTQQATLQQSIASLDSTRANYATRQQALATAQADLASRQATLEQANSEYRRLQSLRSSNAVSQQELEQAATNVKTAQAQLASAQHAINTAKANLAAGQADITNAQATIKKSQTQVNTAEQNLGYTRITAPMSGTIVSITTQQGQTVNANQTAPTIVTMADLKTMRIKARISEADVINVKAGMPVYFNILGNPDKKYTATLSAIEPAPAGTTTNSNSNNSNTDSAIYYMGYFDVPNPNGELRINMTAQVYIVQDKIQNALSVPAAAIKHKKGEGSFVLVVQPDATTKRQPVQVGLTNRVDTQIVSGLSEGQKIVISEANSDDKGKNSGSGGGRSRGKRSPMM